MSSRNGGRDRPEAEGIELLQTRLSDTLMSMFINSVFSIIIMNEYTMTYFKLKISYLNTTLHTSRAIP